MDAIQASDIRRRDAMLQEWIGKRTSYDPKDIPAHIVPPTNAERSACEVFEFMRDKPDSYFLYVTRDKEKGVWNVGTWMGDSLGANVRVGHEYQSNMGDKRRSLYFVAITGESYAGTFFCGTGDYARVRKVKTKR